jgi:hypothetical protein
MLWEGMAIQKIFEQQNAYAFVGGRCMTGTRGDGIFLAYGHFFWNTQPLRIGKQGGWMTRKLMLQKVPQKNPHDYMEDLALSNEWHYERTSDSQMSITLDDFYFNVTFLSHWDQHACYLDTLGIFDLTISDRYRRDAYDILAALSMDTRIGSFTLCPSQRCPLFRHAFLSYPKHPITLHHVNDMFEEALMGAEKLSQAMRLLLEEKKTPQEAVFGSLIEVIGEA